VLPEASRFGHPTTRPDNFRTPCSTVVHVCTDWSWGVGVRIFGGSGWVVSRQVVRERLLFVVVVDGLVSTLVVVG
jgi:hypothetical protein